ncbi:MAG: Gx transporter family protein [Clostridiales bacterium]|nr:Gx transporter family protein [Clostridiales bacterium]
MEINSKLKRTAVDALLTALSLIIFILEAQIPSPVPVPGIKLGLANIITLVAVSLIGKRDAGIILLLRIILGSVFAGTPVSFIYSMAGGICCYLVICLFYRFLNGNRLWALSVFGAAAHNLGQLVVASFIMGSTAVFWYIPALLLSAIITGTFTGLCACFTINRIKKGVIRK